MPTTVNKPNYILYENTINKLIAIHVMGWYISNIEWWESGVFTGYNNFIDGLSYWDPSVSSTHARLVLREIYGRYLSKNIDINKFNLCLLNQYGKGSPDSMIFYLAYIHPMNICLAALEFYKIEPPNWKEYQFV